jgi:hypothetical protein
MPLATDEVLALDAASDDWLAELLELLEVLALLELSPAETWSLLTEGWPGSPL